MVLATAGALVAAFAGLAAKALPGRHAVNAARPASQRAQRQAIPPPLVPVQSEDSGAAAPAAPASPPAQTQAPPVAVSGGT